MATVVKTFTGTEAFTEVGTSADISFSYNPNFSFTCGTSDLVGDMETAIQNTGSTWESWGVPVGATVTHIQITGYTYNVDNSGNQVILNITDFWVVNNSDVNITSSSLKSDSRTTAGTGSGTAGTQRAVLGAYQASTQGVRLKFIETLDTDAGSVSWQYAVDNVDLTITYTLAVTFSGAISSSVAIGGALSVRKDLAGSPTGSVSFTGALSLQKELAGSPTGSVAFAGTLTNYEAVNLAGSPTGSVAFAGGTLSVQKNLSGAPTSSVSFAGFLTNNDPSNIQFSGSPTGSVAFAGALSVQKDFAGDVTGEVSFAGTLTTASFVTGGITSSVEFAGALSTAQDFAGTATGSIAFAGTLTTRGAYEPVGVLESTLLNTGVCASTLIDRVEHKAMGNTFYVKKGDNAETIRTRLSDEQGDVNLTGCTAKVQFRKKGSASVTLEPTATIDPDQSTFTGEVEYAFITSDFTTLVVGEYEVEWKVTFPNGTIRNFPTSRIPTRNYNYMVVYENF